MTDLTPVLRHATDARHLSVKIYVINLDRAEARLKRFQAMAGAAGLAFERLAAVDGAAMGEGERRAVLAGHHRFYPPGPGETGCFLSHRAAWRKIAAADAPFAAVLEDDVAFGPGIAALRDDSWVPPGTDLVKIETDFRRVAYGRDGAQAGRGRRLHALVSRHAGSGGYIVSRGAAATLLSLSEKIADPVDQFLFNPVSPVFAALNVQQLVPALVAQGVNMARAGLWRGLDEALAGELAAERRLPRRRGMAKYAREIARPFAQAGRRLRHAPLPGRPKVRYRRVPLA